MRRRSRFVWLLLTMSGCGAGGGPSTFGDGPPADDGAGADAGAGGQGSTLAVDASSTAPENVDRNAACAQSVQSAKLPVSGLVFQFDRSSSMGKVSDPASKISTCKAALQAFFEDPKSAGLSASLSVFPHRASQETGSLLCTENDYTSPEPGGDLQSLPSPGLAVAASAIATISGTPTLPALKGAYTYAKSQMAAHVGQRLAIVLVTDGQPDACPSGVSVQDVANLAASFRSEVPTYVIGIGQAGNLDPIAQAGSGSNAIFVSTANPQAVSADLLAALQSVAAQAVSCEMPLPAPPPNQALDTSKVNVLVTLGGAPESVLGYSDACAGGTGWHYDDPKAPTKIVMCPATCQAVRADSGAKVELLIGCKTAQPLR